jgi:hypothetical protein
MTWSGYLPDLVVFFVLGGAAVAECAVQSGAVVHHLVIVGRGQVIADTSTADLLTAASGDRVTLRTSAAADAAAVLERAGATITSDGGSGTLTVSGLSRRSS